MEAQTICNAFFFCFFFFKLGWMTLNLQLPQGITLGMAFRYTFIRMSYSITLLMIEVIIRKKYWFSIQVILSWDGNVYIILLLLILFFRFAKYYVKDNVLYRTLLKAYGIRFAILVYGEVISN